LLLQELVDDFVFTASKVLLQCRKNQGDIQLLDQAVPVCQSPATVMATFELLVGLVTGCLQNLRTLSEMLSAMFYTGKVYLFGMPAFLLLSVMCSFLPSFQISGFMERCFSCLAACIGVHGS
jgi:hypothetical protein